MNANRDPFFSPPIFKIIFLYYKNFRSLRHPNIINFFGVSTDEEMNFYMITELATKGSLLALLKKAAASKRGEGIAWSMRLEMMKQIVNGLTYLHSRQIYHRDLKAENILIFPAGDNQTVR